MAEVLARVDLQVDEVVPALGVTFVAYNWYRGGVRFATTDTLATPHVTDWLAPAGTHTYEASWTGDVGGALIESERIAVEATLTWGGAWLHDVGDPAHALRVAATSVSPSWTQDVEYHRPGGSSAPVAFVGRGFASRWRVEAAPEDIRTGDTLARLLALMERASTHGAVLCLRFGYRPDLPGARVYVVAAGPSASWGGALERPSWECVEVAAPEGAA